jgi:myo-inositol catabolism protein IolS
MPFEVYFIILTELYIIKVTYEFNRFFEKMEKRLCKNSGLGLSVTGTGCWAFGGGEYWGDQNQKDVNDVVHASVDLGINYFDTAEVYNEGRSESSLGEAISSTPNHA